MSQYRCFSLINYDCELCNSHACAVDMWKVFLLLLAFLAFLLIFLNIQSFNLPSELLVEKLSFNTKIDLTMVKLEAEYERRRNLVRKVCKSHPKLMNPVTVHRYVLYNSEHRVRVFLL